MRVAELPRSQAVRRSEAIAVTKPGAVQNKADDFGFSFVRQRNCRSPDQLLGVRCCSAGGVRAGVWYECVSPWGNVGEA